MDYHVKDNRAPPPPPPPAKKKKNAQIQNCKFCNSVYNFGRDPPEELHEFGSVKLMCTFIRDVI